MPNIPETLSRLAVPRRLAVPLAAFLVSRLGIFAVAYLADPLIVDNAAPPPYHIRPDNVLLDVFGSRWDTGFYLSIADEGYRYGGVDLPSVAFFPLLPLLISVIAPLVGDPLVAGVLIANGALLGATVLLYRLAADEFGDAVASRSVWYLLIFPTSFFGSAIYSESLFLLGAVGALYFARRGSWPLAALCGFAAGFSRFVGIVAAPMLLLEWWDQRRRRPATSRPPAAAVAAAAVPALATGAYMLYLWRVFGDPLAFAHASSAWGRELSSPLAMVGDLFARPAEGWRSALLAGRLPLDGWIDLFAVLAFLALGGVLLRQRRWSEGALVTLGALIPLASGLLMSQRRYMWVLFPVFVLLGRWGERVWVDRAVTVAFALGLALFTALFANWYWVG
ncbi:MAG TPA: mannosyltransferase family protein [Methylomirabilota bacterium]|nr:mannosyltransferase family protein [Methylomirabilota bacterium]